MNPNALRVAHLPASYEEVEGEVVNPTGEKRARVLEERRDFRERAEAARSPPEGRRDEPEIYERDQERNYDGKDEPRSPTPARQEDEQKPADRREHAAEREDSFGGHSGSASDICCIRVRTYLRSFRISRLAFAPGAPVTPPPGCAPAPHR